MEAVSAGREMPYVWNPKHEARVGLLRRDGSSVDVRWLAVDPCFIFHTLNAYDEGDLVVVDMCHYEGSYDVSLLTGLGPVTLNRWIIDPVAGKVIQKRLDERYQEFPRVDQRVVGRKHRYGYSTVVEPEWQAVLSPTGHFANNTFANVLYKHDVAAGTVEAHNFGSSEAAGEAVFVPTFPDAAEDDGYIMTFVHSLDRGATDLVVLAAQDFTGQPVARVHLPVRVPLGFHGSWIPDR
jgi:carotenoid cleavage dioxygenase